MKRVRLGSTEGAWWRFSRYQIEDGAIRPDRNAKLERYDPWQEFQASRNLTVGQAPNATQPPYQTLMKLVHELEFIPEKKRYPDCLTPDSLGRILAWCQQHGPLGVLLSRWEAIALAPMKDGPDRFVQRRYIRGTGQTIQVLETSGDAGDQQASVIIHGLENLNPIEEPPGKTWHRFFPSVEFGARDTFQYPIPYSDEFCHLYAERVIDFCQAARYVAGAAKYLTVASQPAEGDPAIARSQALQAMNLLRRSVTSILDLDEGGNPYVFWEAPSLLASFAEMYVQDLLFGRPTLTCTCCGMPFVSAAYQAQYCSLSCRYREQKRRLRQQMKEAKNRRAQGQGLAEIAAALGQDRKIIAGWLKRH